MSRSTLSRPTSSSPKDCYCYYYYYYYFYYCYYSYSCCAVYGRCFPEADSTATHQGATWQRFQCQGLLGACCQCPMTWALSPWGMLGCHTPFQLGPWLQPLPTQPLNNRGRWVLYYQNLTFLIHLAEDVQQYVQPIIFPHWKSELSIYMLLISCSQCGGCGADVGWIPLPAGGAAGAWFCGQGDWHAPGDGPNRGPPSARVTWCAQVKGWWGNGGPQERRSAAAAAAAVPQWPCWPVGHP